MNKKTISEVMSQLGYLSNKKSPRTKEQYKAMAKKRWDIHRAKKDVVNRSEQAT